MTQLEQNLNTLQEKIYSLNFDISKSFLPDSEVAKNIITTKNPKMTKADADIMIDGKISDSTKSSMYAASISKSGSTQPITGTSSAATDQLIKSKEKSAEFARKNNIYPLPKDSTFHTEAKKIKSEVRKAFMLMIKEQKELIQDLIKTAIDSGSAIAAAATLCAPMSFNVPGAIVLILKVLDAIAKIISKMTNIIMHAEPLKYLALLIPKESFQSATGPINTTLTTLIGILSVVGFLQSLLSKLMGSLKKTTDPKNLTTQIEKLRSEIGKAQGELDTLKNSKFPDSQKITNKTNEISELQSRLDMILKGPNLPDMDDKGQFIEKPLTEILKDIDFDLAQQQSDVSQLNLQLYDYVYDVYLPDGEVLSGLNDDDFESVKERYNVVIDTQRSD